MLNLDTHVLLRALDGSVTRKEKRLLAQDRWGISAIVLWEIAKLHQLGRIALGLSDRRIKKALRALHVWPLDAAICEQACALDFASGPADELIAATSIVHQAPLLTRDKRILASKRVPFAR